MAQSSFLRPALFVSLALLAAGCNLQKDIDVPQPPFESQLVVECYLEPGKPYRLAIQQTTPFLADPQPSIVTDAVAVITGPRGIDTIRFFPSFDTTTVNSPKGFTHTGFRNFDGQPGEQYALLVYDGAGRRLTGTTTIQGVVPIDTLEVSFNPDSPVEEAKASILTRFRDPDPLGDAYRYHVNQLSKGKLERRQSFSFDDERLNGQRTAVGSSYRFGQNDTMEVTLYHIERAYDRYLQSVDDAQGANGNPFAQPSAIKSTVQGGLGVFTNLVGDRRQLILTR